MPRSRCSPGSATRSGEKVEPRSRPFRVLIVEDRDEDARLLLHELRRAGFEPEWSRVQEEDEFLDHLEPAPDIILADYQRLLAHPHRKIYSVKSFWP